MAIFLFNLVAILGLTLFILSNQVRRRRRDLITLIAKIYIVVIVIGNIILFIY